MWPFGPRNNYPYTDFHELNTDWILAQIHWLTEKVNNFNKNFKEIIDQWLDDHPEATTTIQDGSITPAKMNESFWQETDDLYIRNAADFTVYVPKMEYAGACFFIRDTVNDFNIMLDSGLTESYSDVLDCMTNAGITHLDVVVISHYHNDHVANIPSMCAAGYIDAETVVYRPVDPVWDSMIDNGTYFDTIKAREINVNNALTTAGATIIPVTTENTVVEAGVFQLKFNNCSLLTYAAYYSDVINNADMTNYDHTNYNNFAMVTTVSSSLASMIYTSDIEYLGQETIYQELDRCPDLMTTPHHDDDIRSSAKFATHIKPKYIIQNGSQVSGPKAFGNMALSAGVIYSMENDTAKQRYFRFKDNELTSNAENYNAYQTIFNLPDKVILPGEDLNDYTRPGSYFSQAGSEGLITNEPPVNKTYRMEVKCINRNDAGRCQQDVYTRDGVPFQRYKTSIGGALGWVGWRIVSDDVRAVSAGNRITIETTGTQSGSLYAYGQNGSICLSFRNLRFSAETPVNQTFATLPEQLRPVQSRYIPFSIGAVHGTVYVGTDGAVYFGHLSQNVTTSNYFYLDLIYQTGMTTYSNVD